MRQGGRTKLQIDENGESEVKFNCVVGNPPYQEEVVLSENATNGQAPRTNVFHYFQIMADELAFCSTSLIYPAVRWIHQSGKGLAQFGLEQINDMTLEELNFYLNANDLFKEITGIDDGISIVVKNKKKTTNGFNYVYHENGSSQAVFMNNPKNELIPLNPQNAIIVNKVSNFVNNNNLNYLHDKILSRSLFGIESNFVESNKDKVKTYSDDYKLGNDEIKLFTNDKAGSAGRTCWFVANRNLIKSNSNLIDEYQVVVSSAHPGGQSGRSNQIEIIDNHSAFGRSRVALSSFKTEQEAKNFFDYCNTYLIKFMFLMTDESLTSLGLKVPDLNDYTNENTLLDFNSDLNEQLYKLVDLTQDEIDYIEKTVKK